MKTKPSRWLLLLYQLPPKPDYLRVKIWRRLLALGAVAVKNTVYALPGNERCREDLLWLKKEIEALGGEAALCEARFVDGSTDVQVRALFNQARDVDYAQLIEDLRGLLTGLGRGGGAGEEPRARARRLQKRFDAVAAIDFFSAGGRETAAALLRQIDQALRSGRAAALPGSATSGYTGRVWVTRPGVGVDRMASAWFIQRFVDPAARFEFRAATVRQGRVAQPATELRYDMAEADFTHIGDRCTFEVLLDRFGPADRGLEALARIVHDLDFKDAKFGDEEAAGVAALLRGIEAGFADDRQRIEQAAAVFDVLLPVLGRSAGKGKTRGAAHRSRR